MLEFNIIEIDELANETAQTTNGAQPSCSCGSWFLICGWSGYYVLEEKEEEVSLD